MSRQKWYMDDFINCGLWFLLLGSWFFMGLCSHTVHEAREAYAPKTAATPCSKSTNAPKQIYAAQKPEELKRLMELYGRFDKQKTAQFGVFARYNKIKG